MATIVDYNSLSQALSDWLARSDLTTYQDYFIQLAENRLYRDVFTMNQGRGVKPMEAALSGTIASNAIPVPADYLGLKIALLTTNGNTYPLERKNEEFIYNNFPQQSASGQPVAIARSSSNFIFGPYSDGSYTITGTYWQKATALSSTNTTTWMITSIPEVLFAGVMAAACEFNRDDQGAQLWNNMYTTTLQSFIDSDKAEQWSGSSLAISAA